MENFLKIAPIGFETAMQDAIELPATMETTHLNKGGNASSSKKFSNYHIVIIVSLILGVIGCYAFDIYQKKKRAFVIKKDEDPKKKVTS